MHVPLKIDFEIAISLPVRSVLFLELCRRGEAGGEEAGGLPLLRLISIFKRNKQFPIHLIQHDRKENNCNVPFGDIFIVQQ